MAHLPAYILQIPLLPQKVQQFIIFLENSYFVNKSMYSIWGFLKR